MTDMIPPDTPEGIYLNRVVLTIEVENRHVAAAVNEVRAKYKGQVLEQYPSPCDVWSEDPLFSREEWKADVAQGDTNLGYWAWVQHNTNTLESTASGDTADPRSHAHSTLQLAAEVYRLLKDQTESFETDHIGPDGLYLVGAILNDEQCEWPRGRPILRVLRKHLRPSHPVFKHITR